MTQPSFTSGTDPAIGNALKNGFLSHEEIDLDKQIHIAEHEVIEGDERVQRGIRQLIVRVREQAVQQLGFSLVVGAGALLLSRLLPRRSRGGASTLSAHSAHPLRSAEGWSLAKTLALFWPMLLGGLRRAVPNGIPEMLVGMVLPVLGQLFHRRTDTKVGGEVGQGTRSPPVKSAVQVDLHRYLGQWYEIARLPTRFEKRCASNVMTTYGQIGRRGRISVLNQCQSENGRRLSVRGVARMIEGYGNARLQVSFAPLLLRWLPWVWRDYWVLRVDGDYRHALVGTPDREKLWLLSRTPHMADFDLEQLIASAIAQGFNTDKLILTPQRQ